MKKILIIFAGLFMAFYSKAQKEEIDWEFLGPSSNGMALKITGDIYKFNSIANSNYFLQDDWIKGTLTLEGGIRHENTFMRYNAFNDQLVVYIKQLKVLCTADKETVESFELDDPATGKVLFRKIITPEEKAEAKYYRVLYDGIHSLVAFHKIIEAKTSLYMDIYGRLCDTEFRKTVTYFLYNPDSGFKKVLPKRKSFLSLSPSERNQMRILFRKNGLRYFNEEEMVKAISFLEEEGILK